MGQSSRSCVEARISSVSAGANAIPAARAAARPSRKRSCNHLTTSPESTAVRFRAAASVSCLRGERACRDAERTPTGHNAEAEEQGEANQGALERLQRRVAAARAARAALCDRREALTARNTALAALSARRRRDGPPPPHTPPLPLPDNPEHVSPSLPKPLAPYEPLAPVLESNRRSHDSELRGPSGRAPRTIGGRPHPSTRTLSTAVTRSPRTVYQVPRPAVTPIASFARLSSISFEDLREASGSRTRDVDFSCMGMLAIVDRCQHEKLRTTGPVPDVGSRERDGRASAEARRVCWFIHTSAPASPDQELSLSSTLSSPECIASTVLHYMLAKIEGALLTAAAKEPSGTMSDVSPAREAPGIHMDAGVLPAGAAPAATGFHPSQHQPPGPHPAPTAPSFVSNDTIADYVTSTRGPPAGMHVRHAQRGAPSSSAASGSGLATESAVAPTAGPPEMPHELATAHPVETRQPGAARWSGAVRCGVNGTVCARRAVWHTLYTIISRFGGVLPVEVVRGILVRTRAALSPIASFFLPGREDGEPGAGEAEAAGQAPQRKGGAIVQAATGVLAMVGRTCDYLSQHAVLCSVVGAGCGLSHAGLRERTHTSAVMNSVIYVLTLQDAPRTVRRLAVSGIMPNFFEHKDIHIALFQKLRLSSAQRATCSDHWHACRRHRSHLDRQLQEAVSRLPCASRTGDAVAAVTTTLSMLQHKLSSVVPGSAPSGSSSPAHPVRGHLPLHPRDAAVQAAGKDVAGTHEAGTAHDDALADPSLHEDAACSATSEGWGMWRAHTAAAAELLLGASVTMTEAAGNALAAVRAVHAEDAHTHSVAVAARTQPGRMLEAGQIAQVWAARAIRGATPIDIVELCQLAALQRSREQTLDILHSCAISDIMGQGL